MRAANNTEMPDAAPTSAAEHQREYRERDKSGTRCALAYVPLNLVEKLIEGGLLSEGKPTTNAAEKAAERKRLGTALVDAAYRWAESQRISKSVSRNS